MDAPPDVLLPLGLRTPRQTVPPSANRRETFRHRKCDDDDDDDERCVSGSRMSVCTCLAFGITVAALLFCDPSCLFGSASPLNFKAEKTTNSGLGPFQLPADLQRHLSAVAQSEEALKKTRSSCSPGVSSRPFPGCSTSEEEGVDLPTQFTGYPAPGNLTLSLLFGLRQRNTDEAERLLRAVSSPNSEAYGHYISVEDWARRFGVTAKDRQVLLDHLEATFQPKQLPAIDLRTQQKPSSSDHTDQSDDSLHLGATLSELDRTSRSDEPTKISIEFALSGDFVKVWPCRVDEVEAAYNTTIMVYAHPKYTNQISLRAAKRLNLPVEIASIVEFVNLATPLHHYTKSIAYQTQQSRRLQQSFGRAHPETASSSSPVQLNGHGASPRLSPQHSKDEKSSVAANRGSSKSDEVVRRLKAEQGCSGFCYPARMEPPMSTDRASRGVAPVVNRETFSGGDGYVVLSFMPYCYFTGQANVDALQSQPGGEQTGRICETEVAVQHTGSPVKNPRESEGSQTTASLEPDQYNHRGTGRELFEERKCVSKECVNQRAASNEASANSTHNNEPFLASPLLHYNRHRLSRRVPPVFLNSSDQLDNNAAVYIVGFEVILHQPQTEVTKIVELPAESPVVWTRPAWCGSPCVELNTTIGDVWNFAQTWVSIRSVFSNGYVSPFSPYSEVQPIWPLPFITPSTLYSIYSVPQNLLIRSNRSSLAVAEFLEEYYSQDDLDEFFRLTGVPKQTKPKIIGPNGDRPGEEAQLDMQYIMSLASNITAWFWSVPGRNVHTNQEPFLEWLYEVSNTPDSQIPLVHSVSYGDDELDIELWYAKRLNLEFAKMGLRGITVVVASGDDGASGYHTRMNSSYCQHSRPEIPASLPYVTTVGGTQLTRNAAPLCGMSLFPTAATVQCHFESEKVCMANAGGGITSGGGFSNYFERPWYQAKLVHHYLTYPDHDLPSHDFFNSFGRAYPDLSAYANNFLVLVNREFILVHGTSASTPVVASMLAHFNDRRLSNSLPPLGFFNPLLYKWAEDHPECFQDVLVGDNRCGISPSKCCEVGFPASRGWDAVSGVGTLRFGALLDIAERENREMLLAAERVERHSVLPPVSCDCQNSAAAPKTGEGTFSTSSEEVITSRRSGNHTGKTDVRSKREGTFGGTRRNNQNYGYESSSSGIIGTVEMFSVVCVGVLLTFCAVARVLVKKRFSSESSSRVGTHSIIRSNRQLSLPVVARRI